MAVSYGTGDKRKATILHAELVRARGACTRCGHTENLQCAHIISRTYATTRCRMDNAWCLCARCHRAVDTHADEKMALVDRTIGYEAFKELKTAAITGVGTKVDWAAVLLHLKEIKRVAA